MGVRDGLDGVCRGSGGGGGWMNGWMGKMELAKRIQLN